jgi:DUF1016 N-terminal domain
MYSSVAFGNGFLVDNFENMRRFYLAYSKSETLSRISQTPNFVLSWSHYQMLIVIENKEEHFFMK